MRGLPLAVLITLCAGVAMADESLPSASEIGTAGARDAVQPAIVQLLAAYAQFADAKDPERFGALFTEDGVFRIEATEEAGMPPGVASRWASTSVGDFRTGPARGSGCS